MNRFDYREATSVQEAVDILSQETGGRILAGATDVLARWRQGVWQPQYVLNIKRIPGLDSVDYNPESGLRLGTLATVRTLEQHPLIRTHYPALAQAAAAFAGVQICNLATVGGNVCNASPAGDTLPALLAYGAQCRLIGPNGERSMSLEQFFVGPSQTALETGELLVELRLPPPPPHTGALYIKHSPRRTMDISIAGVASIVSLAAPDGVSQDVRVALGAVAPTVIRAAAVEELLRGTQMDTDSVERAASAVAEDISPIDDIRGTAAHRRAIVVPLVQRTLQHAVQMAQGRDISFDMQRRLAVEAAF